MAVDNVARALAIKGISSANSKITGQSGYYDNGTFYEDSAHTTPITPETNGIYVDLGEDKLYLYDGTSYVEISGGGGSGGDSLSVNQAILSAWTQYGDCQNINTAGISDTSGYGYDDTYYQFLATDRENVDPETEEPIIVESYVSYGAQSAIYMNSFAPTSGHKYFVKFTRSGDVASSLDAEKDQENINVYPSWVTITNGSLSNITDFTGGSNGYNSETGETWFFTGAYPGNDLKLSLETVETVSGESIEIVCSPEAYFEIFELQIFDLTAMYGAGNEPTTKSAFEADYPNEYYSVGEHETEGYQLQQPTGTDATAKVVEALGGQYYSKSELSERTEIWTYSDSSTETVTFIVKS